MVQHTHTQNTHTIPPNTHRGQGQSLTLDQQQLYRSLYRMLDDIILVFQETDIPPGVDTDDTHTASHHDTHNDTQTTRHSHPQQHPPPQHAQHATTTTTTTTCMDTTTNVAHAAAVLLSGMLLDRKSLDSARMVAFAKAVARSGVLVTESGMAAGCLSVLHRMLRCVRAWVFCCWFLLCGWYKVFFCCEVVVVWVWAVVPVQWMCVVVFVWQGACMSDTCTLLIHTYMPLTPTHTHIHASHASSECVYNHTQALQHVARLAGGPRIRAPRN